MHTNKIKKGTGPQRVRLARLPLAAAICLAMAAPAFVSVIAGLTALLYSQDGTLRRR